MSSMTKYPDDTAHKVLMTAMSMFGTEGVDAVSLRRINTESGTANTSAVHYYFSNKDGLVQAIIDFLHEKIWHPALVELQDLVAEEPDLRTVLEVGMWPGKQVLLKESWGIDAQSFCFQVITGLRNDYRLAFKKITDPQVTLMIRALRELLPEISEETLKQRIKFLMTEALVGHWTRTRIMHAVGLPNWTERIEQIYYDEYIDYTMGGLLAPSSR